jgi:hypothetical protein
MARVSERAGQAEEIARLRREVADIQSMLHDMSSPDLEDQIFALKGMREDAVRALVLHVSLAVEDVLDDLLRIGFLGRLPTSSERRRSKGVRVVDELLIGLSFEKKLQIARAAKVITKRHYDELNELRRVRNRCAHRWLLDDDAVRASKQSPVPLGLKYRNRDLFETSVLKRFRSDYGRIYLSLFGKLFPHIDR